MTWRTSVGPPVNATIFDVNSSARASFSTSMI
jgi:hypothetical protein